MQFKNNLWPFLWQSPLKLLSGAGFKKSLHRPIRGNKKSTAVMLVDNREFMWHWKKMRHHYKWPGNKNYHQLLKWLDWKTLSPPDTWEDGLYIEGTEGYIGISVPGSLVSLSGEVVRKPGGRWKRGNNFLPC